MELNNIEVHAAPLQGITDFVWRNAHSEVFGGIACYHTPFMRVERGEIRKRDINDVANENNQAHIVPQILACKSQDMKTMISTLKTMGYSKVEINLGCPFLPIMKKHKGCGLMAYPDEMSVAFGDIATINDMSYTLKMRLGVDSSIQWRQAMKAIDILNPEYITLHPRIGLQNYQGDIYYGELEAFLSVSRFPVIYNGDIKTVDDIHKVIERYPTLKGVMIGRGLIADPSLTSPALLDKADNYRRFHQLVFDGTQARFSGGDHQVLMHMKAMWEMFLPNASHKLRKRIIKAHNLSQYEMACNELFAEIEAEV